MRALAHPSAIRVPAPAACDSKGDCAPAFLVLEWLDFGAGGRDAALGLALARLHRTTAEAYGWQRDNTIGTTPQDNARTEDWAAFFRDRRMHHSLRSRRAAATAAGCSALASDYWWQFRFC